jgi:hypothetical protein
VSRWAGQIHQYKAPDDHARSADLQRIGCLAENSDAD